jgi:hypothetical protein
MPAQRRTPSKATEPAIAFPSEYSPSRHLCNLTRTSLLARLIRIRAGIPVIVRVWAALVAAVRADDQHLTRRQSAADLHAVRFNTSVTRTPGITGNV